MFGIENTGSRPGRKIMVENPYLISIHLSTSAKPTLSASRGNPPDQIRNNCSDIEPVE
jgi:hypothetical protein